MSATMPSHSTTAPDYEVVICTYNGALFIGEQLSSILAQQPAPAGVIISDDGSTDDTLAVIEAQAHSSTVPVRIIQGPGKGIIQNMLSALKHTRANYVFLADQDDMWMDNKAPLFCEQMRETSAPHLIFSNAWVWRPGQKLKTSLWEADGLKPENAHDPQKLAFHNAVQGASACVNQALIQALKPHPDIAMHDWWLGLIAAGTGEVSVVEQPTLLYRQHAGNQVGVQAQRTHSGGPIERLKQKRAASGIVLRQALAFAQLYAQELPSPQSDFFKAYATAITSSVLQRLGFLLKWRPVRKNLLRTLTLWLSILGTRCAPRPQNPEQPETR
ncbi:glycosyltransferase family 2 protein [Marinimicrobium sp. ABcell2]|uniref:glycosyltransferase family 2 protein n=1 Tax=Marinimicrobium sp. ABcell2 TaxID=3069751 RepID=UPI0027B0EB98|nr:glycosyltransferase family 2 protein [Marinimicrobium sp. ABcell2]MDQ2078345.1 glycosyltransferase family 2 protein [Marinimicrobium sp. ABcell2]